MNHHTAAHVAQLLNKSTRHITDLCRQGKFPGAYQHGSRKSWLIPAEAVAEVLAEQPLDITVMGAEVAELVPRETMQEFMVRVVEERVAEVVKRQAEELEEVRRECAEAMQRNQAEVQEMRAELDEMKKKKPGWLARLFNR
jgi:gas vesicle protein